MTYRKTSIFISHAWGGLSDEILAQLVKRLEAEDIGFVLDKRDLSYRQSIRDFMVQLGEADMVIIILSNKYLKSEYCMFELLEIHKNENLRERIFPIVLDEVKISSSSDRLEFVKYWETQLIDLQNKVKELNSLSYIEGITDDLNLYSEIRNNIARLTGILRDINTLNIKLHQEADYNDLVRAIKNRIAGKDKVESGPQATAKSQTSLLDSNTFKRAIVVVFALFGLFMAWGILTKSKLFAEHGPSDKDQTTGISMEDTSKIADHSPPYHEDTLTNTSSANTEVHPGKKLNPISNSRQEVPSTSIPEKPGPSSSKSPADAGTSHADLPAIKSKEETTKEKDPTLPVQPKLARKATIPKGTELFARSNSTFSSDDAFTPPKRVYFSLDKPLESGGEAVIPAGSTILAKVTYVKPSHQTRAGVMDFVFEYLQAPDGQKIPLQTNEFHLVAKGDNPMEITTQTIYKIKTSSTQLINY